MVTSPVREDQWPSINWNNRLQLQGDSSQLFSAIGAKFADNPNAHLISYLAVGKRCKLYSV
jgi:hypothetical protein